MLLAEQLTEQELEARVLCESSLKPSTVRRAIVEAPKGLYLQAKENYHNLTVPLREVPLDQERSYKARN